MNAYKEKQLESNKLIAKKNKKMILKRLEEYYKAIYSTDENKAKEYAILLFWQAKKQGRLDNLNRIVK